jgi:hypothetical protein
MICHDLAQLWNCSDPLFSPFALAAGARAINEPKARPECQLSPQALEILHEQMDSFLHYEFNYGPGWRQERNDLDQLLRWSKSLHQALFDRRNGVR